ncbi:hypothetical protein AHMF7605_02910 [Adhaeribacter arboris]|uniref:Peptidase S8/S53 domain-containing protein n=1 Tax=Adhaeribacter arboris TaxID=2072846 RepID=A0A2T2YAT2_9BACT|nr:hypothetical protein [Adhaeribacter arboris]PSR52548.1 hypothetical protein AHMF7605_02910 [Adhaeribacter arboris]
MDANDQPRYYTTFDDSKNNAKTTFAIDAASTTSTDELWQGGLLGLELAGSSTGIKGKLGIWNGGAVRNTHYELTSRITQQDKPTSQDGQDHATHVAGIMVGAGVNPRAREMAFKSVKPATGITIFRK